MQMLWQLESSIHTHLLFEIEPAQRREDELREVGVGGKVKDDVRIEEWDLLVCLH